MQVHLLSSAEEQDLLNELTLASGVEHPNIVRFVSAYDCLDAQGDHIVWIVMEMMLHGALNEILGKSWRVWQVQYWTRLISILSAMMC